MLRTSVLTALLVGTALVAIDQGAAIARDGLTGGIAWRATLTYLIPFCVATWGHWRAAGADAALLSQEAARRARCVRVLPARCGRQRQARGPARATSASW
jgi:hypothetical protein